MRIALLTPETFSPAAAAGFFPAGVDGGGGGAAGTGSGPAGFGDGAGSGSRGAGAVGSLAAGVEEAGFPSA